MPKASGWSFSLVHLWLNRRSMEFRLTWNHSHCGYEFKLNLPDLDFYHLIWRVLKPFLPPNSSSHHGCKYNSLKGLVTGSIAEVEPAADLFVCVNWNGVNGGMVLGTGWGCGPGEARVGSRLTCCKARWMGVGTRWRFCTHNNEVGAVVESVGRLQTCLIYYTSCLS